MIIQTVKQIAAIENFSPEAIKAVTRDLKAINAEPLSGVIVLPGDDNITELTAVIIGPVDTPYQEGCFKVKLILGGDYPVVPPKGFFLTKIFHPNVSASGEICVNTLKKDWNKDLGLRHILLTIKCLLIEPNPDSALNAEAGRLLLENYEDYYRHAQMMTKIHAAGVRAEFKKEIETHLGSSNNSAENDSASKDAAASISSGRHEKREADHTDASAGGNNKRHAADVNAKKKVDDKKKSLKRL